MSSPRVFQTCVINANIDKVWAMVRELKFNQWIPNVAKVECNESHCNVGSIVTLTYNDDTVQKVRIVALSDLKCSIVFEMIDSTPPVSFLSVLNTIKLTPVTTTNQTFMEWTSLFSGDASLEVIEDSKFKKHEAFALLSKTLSK